MNMIRTVKFKLPNFSAEPMVEQSVSLFDWYLDEIGRLGTYDKNKLHHATYRAARKRFPLLKSAQIQSVRDHASAVAKRFEIHRGKHKQLKKKSLTMAINNRCFSFKGNAIRYSTLSGVRQEAITVLPF